MLKSMMILKAKTVIIETKNYYPPDGHLRSVSTNLAILTIPPSSHCLEREREGKRQDEEREGEVKTK